MSACFIAVFVYSALVFASKRSTGLKATEQDMLTNVPKATKNYRNKWKFQEYRIRDGRVCPEAQRERIKIQLSYSLEKWWIILPTFYWKSLSCTGHIISALTQLWTNSAYITPRCAMFFIVVLTVSVWSSFVGLNCALPSVASLK